MSHATTGTPMEKNMMTTNTLPIKKRGLASQMADAIPMMTARGTEKKNKNEDENDKTDKKNKKRDKHKTCKTKKMRRLKNPRRLKQAKELLEEKWDETKLVKDLGEREVDDADEVSTANAELDGESKVTLETKPLSTRNKDIAAKFTINHERSISSYLFRAPKQFDGGPGSKSFKYRDEASKVAAYKACLLHMKAKCAEFGCEIPKRFRE